MGISILAYMGGLGMINCLLDYYKIISISWPILARANMGLDFVSGQYGCLFSRCRMYVINIYYEYKTSLYLYSKNIVLLQNALPVYYGF
jgi:hypothetical protein